MLEPEPINFWRNPGTPTPQAHWIDPFPQLRGMLTAEYITRYATDSQMIEHFRPENLKTSSYRLTLGRWCQVEGKDITLGSAEPFLLVPPNSLAFVAVAERLRLPHYIAARFNLMIDLVYKGLLLGTGPQVDPGFQGVLSFPLHNLSSNELKMTLGQHVATIDFVRTSPLADVLTAPTITTEDELYRVAEDHQIPLFDRRKRWKQPVVGYQTGVVKSSIQGLGDRLGRVELFDRIAIISSLAVAAGIAIGAIAVTWADITAQRDLGNEVRTEVTQVQTMDAAIKDCLKRLLSASASPSSRPSPVACPSISP